MFHSASLPLHLCDLLNADGIAFCLVGGLFTVSSGPWSARRPSILTR